jgi:hypothetical protein
MDDTQFKTLKEFEALQTEIRQRAEQDVSRVFSIAPISKTGWCVTETTYRLPVEPCYCQLEMYRRDVAAFGSDQFSKEC